MNDFKNLSDDTLLRIRVPKALYEGIKAKLTLEEAKGKSNFGAGMEVVKEKKSASSDKPKKPNAPVRVTPDNEVKADKDTEKMGAGVSEDNAPDPIDALLKKQDFIMGLKAINQDDRFNKFMDAVWNNIPVSYKSKAITALKSFAQGKTTAPTPDKKLGPPPVPQKSKAPVPPAPPRKPGTPPPLPPRKPGIPPPPPRRSGPPPLPPKK